MQSEFLNSVNQRIKCRMISYLDSLRSYDLEHFHTKHATVPTSTYRTRTLNHRSYQSQSSLQWQPKTQKIKPALHLSFLTCKNPIPPYFSSMASLMILAHCNIKIYIICILLSLSDRLIVRMFLHNIWADFLAVKLHLVRHVSLGCQGEGEHYPPSYLNIKSVSLGC